MRLCTTDHKESKLSDPVSAGMMLTLVLKCDFNVYCPECHPGGTIVHPGVQQKKFLPFGHGRDPVAFNGTGLCTSPFKIGPR